MRWQFQVFIPFVAIVLSWCICNGGHAQSRAKRIKQLYAQAAPFIQEALGRKVPNDIQFQVVDTKTLATIPSWNVKTFLSWRFPGTKREQWLRTYERCHDLYCQRVVARHLEGTHKIVVVPDQLPTIAKTDKSLRNVYSLQFLQLAIVHEVVRLSLEEEYNLLDKRFDPHSLDDVRIQRSLIEGRAQWVTQHVARRLKTDSYFPLLKHVWDVAAKAKIRENGLHDAWQATVQMQRDSYGKGLAFFHLMTRVRPPVHEAQIFQNPPQQWAWIENPRGYLAVLPRGDLGLRKVITKLQTQAVLKGWKARQQAWTPNLLVQVGELLEAKDRAATIARHWVDGHSLIWVQTANPTVNIALNVTRYDAAESARAYYGFALDLQRKREEYLAKALGNSAVVGKSRVRGINLSGVDDAMSITTLVEGDSNQTPSGMVLARKGPVVIEVHFRGISTDVRWAEDAIHRTLRAVRITEDPSRPHGSGPEGRQ